MSADKRNETKIPEDENVDSGFLSGPCETTELYSGEVQSESEKPKVAILCDFQSEPQNECDSGALDLCLSDLQISDTHLTPLEPVVYTVPRPEEPNTRPPIVIFFQPDDDGDTQLHIASVHGCEKSVGTLIKLCPNKELLDVANDDGHTPLHLAVMSRNAVVTRMLVRAGVSLGVRDRAGDTPLHKATASGQLECLQALLAPVPEHRPRRLASILNQKNYNGQACVHLAAAAGNVEVLQTLVYYGADINIAENLAGWTALHIAAMRGHARVVAWLRERCPGVALRPRDYAGRTPRRLARHLTDLPEDSDSASDSDDDTYDSDSESLFDRLRETMTPINVV